MKLSLLISELQQMKKEHGDIEVELQDKPSGDDPVINHEKFFIVPEEYEDGWYVNIRWWPY